MNHKLFRKTLFSIVSIFLVMALGFFGAKFFTNFIGNDLYEVGADGIGQYVNVALLGVDADGLRTDTIMLAQYDKTGKAVHVLQIPRDTRIETRRADKKINSAFMQGSDKEFYSAIEALTGIEVDKYVLINTKAFRQVIDEIGGVKYNVPIDMDYDDPTQDLHIHIKKGEQVLDGANAEGFVRFRHNNDGSGYPDQDLGRMKAQRDFLMAVADKALSIGNIAKIPTYYGIFKENIETNLTAKQVTSLMTELLTVDKSNIQFHDLPGKAQYIGGGSYVIVDTTAARALAEEYFHVGGKSSRAKSDEAGNE